MASLTMMLQEWMALPSSSAKDLGIGEMASEFNQQVDEGIALVSGKRPF